MIHNSTLIIDKGAASHGFAQSRGGIVGMVGPHLSIRFFQ